MDQQQLTAAPVDAVVRDSDDEDDSNDDAVTDDEGIAAPDGLDADGKRRDEQMKKCNGKTDVSLVLEKS